MRRRLFLICFIFFNAVGYSQCRYQFSKISKFEEGYKKDGYGNITDKRILKCILPNGNKVEVYSYSTEFANEWQSSFGVATLLYAGTNASKTAFIRIIKNNTGIHIDGYYFIKGSTDKVFSYRDFEWDPNTEDVLGFRPSSDYFKPSEGWAFSKISGDIIIMTKNGVEFKISTINKTVESYCKMFFKVV